MCLVWFMMLFIWSMGLGRVSKSPMSFIYSVQSPKQCGEMITLPFLPFIGSTKCALETNHSDTCLKTNELKDDKTHKSYNYTTCSISYCKRGFGLQHWSSINDFQLWIINNSSSLGLFSSDRASFIILPVSIFNAAVYRLHSWLTQISFFLFSIVLLTKPSRLRGMF